MYNHWKGRFYPRDIPKTKWFSYYASMFRTVELNSPFYHFPKDETVKKWAKESPEDFIFTMKASRIITHVKRFSNASEWIERFYNVCSLLEEKLGCILFQLPPSMKFSTEKLAQIVSQIDPDFRNVVEFRHPSWYNEEVYAVFREQGIIFCTVSSPTMPDQVVKTADNIYLRFHGSNFLYAGRYSKKQLENWSKKIRKARPKTIWAYFNNDAFANAPKNCIELSKIF